MRDFIFWNLPSTGNKRSVQENKEASSLLTHFFKAGLCDYLRAKVIINHTVLRSLRFFWEVGEVCRVSCFLFCLDFFGFGMVCWSTTSFCTDLSVRRALSHVFSITTLPALCFYPFLNMFYQRCHHLWVVRACCKQLIQPQPSPNPGHAAAPSASTWPSVVQKS